MFGRKAPPRDGSNGMAAAIEVEVVSIKHFCHNIARGVVRAALSWVGLFSPAEGTCAAIAAIPADLAGTSVEQSALHDLLHEFKDVFAAPGKPPQSRIKHCIELVDPTKPPSKHHCYCKSQLELDKLCKQLNTILEKGWIAPSCSPYGHPVLFARKKCGALRLCVDFHSLNVNMQLDHYPLPGIDKLLNTLP